MAGAMHPPFRRKKFRSAPSPPGGEDCARSIPSSSPHKIYDFAGAPFLRKERMRRARWKRENGGAARYRLFDTHVFGPRRSAGGGLDVVESTLFSLRCRLLGGCGGWLCFVEIVLCQKDWGHVSAVEFVGLPHGFAAHGADQFYRRVAGVHVYFLYTRVEQLLE